MTSVDEQIAPKLAMLAPDLQDVWEAVSYLTLIHRYGPMAFGRLVLTKGPVRTTLLQSILVAFGLLQPVLEADKIVRLKISEAGIELPHICRRRTRHTSISCSLLQER